MKKLDIGLEIVYRKNRTRLMFFSITLPFVGDQLETATSREVKLIKKNKGNIAPLGLLKGDDFCKSPPLINKTQILFIKLYIKK